MLSTFKSLLLVSVFITDTYAGENTQSLVQKLHSPDVSVRTLGVQIVLNNHLSLKDSIIRSTLVKLAESETNGSGWGEQEEFPVYQNYYGLLIRTVQNIAVQFHSDEAWDQLVLSHYNDETDFSKWLAGQPEAINRSFYFASDQSDVFRSRAVALLATGLAICQVTRQGEACSSIIPKSAQILNLLRENSLGVETSSTRAESVWGLGICGGKEELPFLESLIKPDSNPWFVMSVHRAEKRIKDRSKLPG